jgi:hypothetical protein
MEGLVDGRPTARRMCREEFDDLRVMEALAGMGFMAEFHKRYFRREYAWSRRKDDMYALFGQGQKIHRMAVRLVVRRLDIHTLRRTWFTEFTETRKFVDEFCSKKERDSFIATGNKFFAIYVRKHDELTFPFRRNFALRFILLDEGVFAKNMCRVMLAFLWKMEKEEKKEEARVQREEQEQKDEKAAEEKMASNTNFYCN